MTESIESPQHRTLIERIRAEYDEQPALRLTPSQAQRLFGGTPHETAICLECLVANGVLQRSPDGHFVRARTSNVIALPGASAGNRWWIRARYRRFSAGMVR